MSNFSGNRDMENQVCPTMKSHPGKKRERSLDEESEEVRSISPPVESYLRTISRTRSQQCFGLSEGTITNSVIVNLGTNNERRNSDSYGWFLALDKN